MTQLSRRRLAHDRQRGRTVTTGVDTDTAEELMAAETFSEISAS